MKKNIIFSWVDATWKTIRVKNLLNQWYDLSVLMEEIDIARYSIKENIKIALEQGSQSNKAVMDRSVIDLLAYYYINNKSWLTDINTWIWGVYWIKKILKEFIIFNKWATFNYMMASQEKIIERLRKREKQWKALSENDLKIINKEGYLEDFIITFNKIINIFERLNKKVWNLIEINKIDTTDLPKPIVKN